MTMARLQLTLSKDDPLFHRENPTKQYTWNEHRDSTRTVLDEMLARFNTKHQLENQHHSRLDSILDRLHVHHHSSSSSWESDLIIFRDVYSFASPKMCDSVFAQQFDHNQVRYVKASPFSPVYYRVVVDKDIIPRMPPTCSTDKDDERELLFPCPSCPQHRRRHQNSKTEHVNRPGLAYTSLDSSQTLSVDMRQSSYPEEHDKDHHHEHSPPLGSLLDYRHVGQLVTVYNTALPPLVKPSEFQTDLTGGTLRYNSELLELLSKLEMTLEEAQTQLDYDSDDEERGNSMGYNTFPSKSSSTPPSSTSATNNPLSPPVSVQAILHEMSQANARHEADTLARLRVPCDAERFLLTFPNVISHSPVTYQRNLARARFFFTSFPGPEFEKTYAAVLARQETAQVQRRERRQGETRTRKVQVTTTTREVVLQMDRQQEIVVAV